MDNEAHVRPKGEIGARSPINIKLAQVVGARVTTNGSGAKVSMGFKMTRRSW